MKSSQHNNGNHNAPMSASGSRSMKPIKGGYRGGGSGKGTDSMLPIRTGKGRRGR